MILGVGLDLVDLAGFRAQLSDSASQFARETFTPRERDDSAARASGDPAQHLAGRFAAKEAFVKAWSSTRFGRTPVLSRADLRDIEVVTDPYGRPALRLHGTVAAAVARSGLLRMHLSLSHDGGTAAAVVVLEQAGTESGEP